MSRLSHFEKERRAVERAFADGALSPRIRINRLLAIDRREERTLKKEAEAAANNLAKFYTRAEDAKRQRQEARERAKEREKTRRLLHRSISRYEREVA